MYVDVVMTLQRGCIDAIIWVQYTTDKIVISHNYAVYRMINLNASRSYLRSMLDPKIKQIYNCIISFRHILSYSCQNLESILFFLVLAIKSLR